MIAKIGVIAKASGHGLTPKPGRPGHLTAPKFQRRVRTTGLIDGASPHF